MKPWNYTLALLILVVCVAAVQAQAAATNRMRAARFGTKTLSLRPAQDDAAPATASLSPAASGAALRLTTGAVDTRARRTAAALAGELAASAQVRSPRGRLPLLVQFDGPATPAARAALAGAGCNVVGYVAPNGYLLDAPAARLDALAAVPGLRWLGEYKPAYKLSPALAAARTRHAQLLARAACTNDVLAGKQPPNTSRLMPPAEPGDAIEVTIQLFSADDLDDTLRRVTEYGVRDAGAVMNDDPAQRWARLRARVPFAALDAIANLAAVQWLEPYTAPKPLNNAAVQPHLMNVTPVWHTNWLGLTGRGQIVGHADTGLDTGSMGTLHPDFTNRVRAAFAWGRATAWSDPDGHGTHTAGSLAGNGSALSNGQFKAPAYEAQLVHQSLYLNADFPLGGLPTNLNLLFEQAYATNARIHSDSWGTFNSGAYDAHARDVDEFMWQHPDMLLVFAAGNSSDDAAGNGVVSRGTLASPGCAKNVLSVGAAESDRPAGSGGYSSRIYGSGYWEPLFPANPIHDDLISTSADGIHQGMFALSSRGPAADGRIKPDIVAPGTDVISCRSHASGAHTYWGAYNNNYFFAGGTSVAAPLTASAAALVRQYFMERHSVVISNPSAALVKATLLNGARSLTPGQYGYAQYREIPAPPRPNVAEGWGHVNLAAALTNLTVWDAQTLSGGATAVYAVALTDTNAVSVVLAWSDYPGTLGAAQALVNDLDLQFITPDGITHYPNGLTGPDHTNNVEGIDVAVAPPGVCTVLVSGVVNMGGAQPFALVVRGAQPVVAQHGIESASFAPATVRPVHTPLVSAVITTNASGLADVMLHYRVDHGAWSTLPMAVQLPIETGGIYTNSIPAQATGAKVELYVTATANDGTPATSATLAYQVGDYAVFVWHGATPTPPYDTWATGFTTLYSAVASPFVTEGYLIYLTNGTYLSTDSGGSDGIIVNKGVRIIGANGPAVTFLSGGYQARVLTIINANAVVEGVTIHEGWAQYGEGIFGGGIYMLNGVVRSCIVRDNYAYGMDANGGGVALDGNGLVDSCIVRDNHAWGGWDAGGGGALLAGKASVRNALLVYNEANSGLNNAAGGNIHLAIGGTVSNCTAVAGTAQSSYGGGVYIYRTGAVHNAIVYFNNNGNFAHNNSGNPAGPLYRWDYTCVTPLPSGTGVQGVSNIASNPQLVNYTGYDCHLTAASPCRDAGQFLPWMTNALDAGGQPRARGASVDMGALEFGPFSISFTATPLSGLAPLPVRFTTYPGGDNTNGAYYYWDFNNDGSNDLEGFACDRPTNVYAEGLFTPALAASNELGELATWQREDYVYAFNTNIHYAAVNGGHVWPFTSWAAAATNIAEALGACLSGHSVVVSDGVYRLSSGVSVGNGVTLRSLNGRDKTVLDGRQNDSCLYLASGALAEGLTLSNGYGNGAGVYFNRGGTLRNARIVNNRGTTLGGGAYFYRGGTLEDAIVMNNYGSTYGGGLDFDGNATANNCVIMNNVGYNGGGVCVYSSPTATLRNCLIVSNTATMSGGGVYAYYNCVIEHCTIAGNFCTYMEGAGLYVIDVGTPCNATVRNSIIANNRAQLQPYNWFTNRGATITFQNVCTVPPAGSNWLTNDPRFVNSAARDYRLRGDSYCVNAGQNLGWMSGAVDLDGNARIINGAPDLGPYELNTNAPLLRVTVSSTDGNQLSALNFGNVWLDATNSMALCLRNAGGSVLSGAVAGVVAPFWCAGDTNYALGVNSNSTLAFSFAPPSNLLYTATVQFSGGGGASVALRGTGIPEPATLALLALGAACRLFQRRAVQRDRQRNERRRGADAVGLLE